MAQPLVDASSHRSNENQAQPSGQRIPMSAFAVQKASKTPFADVTNRNPETAREESEILSTTVNGRGVLPPSKRLKLDDSQRKLSRQLKSSQLFRSPGYFGVGKETDEGQPGHDPLHGLEARPERADEGRSSIMLTGTRRSEAPSELEQEDCDSKYSTDTEEDR